MTQQSTIVFDNLPVFDSYGNLTEEISGEFTAEQLGENLVNKWVSYIKCHRKCPRCDTCKFTIPVPGSENTYKEIRCGVQATLIKNFVKLSFNTLLRSEQDQQEKLLGCAYYLSEFSLDAEFSIGMLINDHTIDWLGEHALHFFGGMVHLREKLNKAGQLLSQIPQIYTHKPILLVEGESEKSFLDKLRESHISWFSDLRVEVYGGSGNKQPKRISMRLEKYIEDGYVCYMQGDKDGKKETPNLGFQKLIKQGVVDRKNIFLFEYDFETSVPSHLLLLALQRMGYLENIGKDVFSEKIDRSNSARNLILEHFGLEIEPLKVELADEIGWIINNIRFLITKEKSRFLDETELGNFLYFVKNMQ